MNLNNKDEFSPTKKNIYQFGIKKLNKNAETIVNQKVHMQFKSLHLFISGNGRAFLSSLYCFVCNKKHTRVRS